MARNKHIAIIFRFVAVLTMIFMIGVMLFPAIAGTLETDRDECKDCENCDDCKNHDNTVCGCIGCPSITLAYEIPLQVFDPILNVLAYDIINISNDFKCNFFDRLDRPPKHSPTNQA
ncbi:MAG: hypothetical protein GY865_07535 [candidate division Zixibacteria bacterium]|nr:hypothetical protein [candidate division Zixibacteria bacterium]